MTIKNCWCSQCNMKDGWLGPQMMSVCPQCGDKRCAKAADHINQCSTMNIKGVKLTESTEKPPVGLRPKWVAEYHAMRDRALEITEAMARYSTAGRTIPIKWITELDELISNYIPKHK